MPSASPAHHPSSRSPATCGRVRGVAGDGSVGHLLVGRPVSVGHGYGVRTDLAVALASPSFWASGFLKLMGTKVDADTGPAQILLRVGAVGGGEGIVRIEHTVAVLVEAVGALPYVPSGPPVLSVSSR